MCVAHPPLGRCSPEPVLQRPWGASVLSSRTEHNTATLPTLPHTHPLPPRPSPTHSPRPPTTIYPLIPSEGREGGEGIEQINGGKRMTRTGMVACGPPCCSNYETAHSRTSHMDLSANNARDQCSIPTLNFKVLDPPPHPEGPRHIAPQSATKRHTTPHHTTPHHTRTPRLALHGRPHSPKWVCTAPALPPWAGHLEPKKFEPKWLEPKCSGQNGRG